MGAACGGGCSVTILNHSVHSSAMQRKRKRQKCKGYHLLHLDDKSQRRSDSITKQTKKTPALICAGMGNWLQRARSTLYMDIPCRDIFIPATPRQTTPSRVCFPQPPPRVVFLARTPSTTPSARLLPERSLALGHWWRRSGAGAMSIVYHTRVTRRSRVSSHMSHVQAPGAIALTRLSTRL